MKMATTAYRDKMLMTEMLRASVSSMNEQNDVLTDESEVIPAFCQSLEAVLRQGLKKGLGAIGLADRDYWNCIEGLTSSSRVHFRLRSENKVITRVPLSKVIKNLRSVPILASTICLSCDITCAIMQKGKVSTSQSRGRLFIRIALTKGIMLQALESLLQNQDYVSYWYKDFSLLVNYQDKVVIMEIMKTLKKKQYKLNTQNCCFLDETWLIPEFQHFELAPISSLGLTLYSDEGKCIIVDVKPGSVGEEKGMVPGDCLDDLYGQVIDEKWATKIGLLKKRNMGKPVTVTIVKGRYKDGRWFPPLFARYSNLCNSGKCIALDLTNKTNTEEKKSDGALKSSYDVIYYGAHNVGKNGSCIFVPDAIRNLLATQQLLNKKLKLQLMERDILLTCPETGEVYARHSYTETSSCSIGDNDAKYFGFITGNTTCSLADQFQCHVFSALTPALSKQMVEGIGKGFDRTIYCV